MISRQLMLIFPIFFLFSNRLKERRSYGKKIFNRWLQLTAPPTKKEKWKNHRRISDFRQIFSISLEKLRFRAVYSWKKIQVKNPENERTMGENAKKSGKSEKTP